MENKNQLDKTAKTESDDAAFITIAQQCLDFRNDLQKKVCYIEELEKKFEFGQVMEDAKFCLEVMADPTFPWGYTMDWIQSFISLINAITGVDVIQFHLIGSFGISARAFRRWYHAPRENPHRGGEWYKRPNPEDMPSESQGKPGTLRSTRKDPFHDLNPKWFRDSIESSSVPCSTRRSNVHESTNVPSSEDSTFEAEVMPSKSAAVNTQSRYRNSTFRQPSESRYSYSGATPHAGPSQNVQGTPILPIMSTQPQQMQYSFFGMKSFTGKMFQSGFPLMAQHCENQFDSPPKVQHAFGTLLYFPAAGQGFEAPGPMPSHPPKLPDIGTYIRLKQIARSRVPINLNLIRVRARLPRKVHFISKVVAEKLEELGTQAIGKNGNGDFTEFPSGTTSSALSSNSTSGMNELPSTSSSMSSTSTQNDNTVTKRQQRKPKASHATVPLRYTFRQTSQRKKHEQTVQSEKSSGLKMRKQKSVNKAKLLEEALKNAEDKEKIRQKGLEMFTPKTGPIMSGVNDIAVRSNLGKIKVESDFYLPQIKQEPAEPSFFDFNFEIPNVEIEDADGGGIEEEMQAERAPGNGEPDYDEAAIQGRVGKEEISEIVILNADKCHKNP